MIGLLILSSILILVGLAYLWFIKPYLTVKKIKQQFEKEGFKVLVEPLDFTKDMFFLGLLKDQ